MASPTLLKICFIFQDRKNCLKVNEKILTGQKVPDLLDQISQILIAPVHFFFGSIGFQQNILSISVLPHQPSVLLQRPIYGE